MKNLLLLLSLFGFFVFATSCDDDDEVDCDALEEEYGDLFEDYFDVCLNYELNGEDCGDCKESIESLLDLYDQAGSCIEDADDQEELEEFKDELEDQLDALDC